MVYDRLEDTPPRAALSEPKRIIGGKNTKVAMNCGVYVDPISGDIYNVNGDTEDWMTVWTRDQKGNVPASRELRTPHRAFGVVVDEEAKELFVSIQHPPAVLAWPKMAQGKDAPNRILEGEHTLLAEPQGLAVDSKNQLLFVSNVGSTASHANNIGWSRALKPGTTGQHSSRPDRPRRPVPKWFDRDGVAGEHKIAGVGSAGSRRRWSSAR